MSQVLYRKYRSKNLSELVGQDHIVRALQDSTAKGKIAHAYLFTGPRGTGKTSVARILAHDINGIPYDEQATHLDIIEIDAASNRRIDEIRDLREKVHIAPTSLKYKVYIIDEVHMLTKEAFNALLKTLEEPPKHAIFILATTELAKVPDTIISRTQRYSFRPIENSKIVEHLTSIAKKENISISESALTMIADHAQGGFRDAISLLDQVRHQADEIDEKTVMVALGIPPSTLIAELYDALATNNDSHSKLVSLYDQGYHATQIAEQLLDSALKQHNVTLARALVSVISSHDPKTELLLATMSHREPSATPSIQPQRIEKTAEPTIEITPETAETVVRQEVIEQTNNPWQDILAKTKQSQLSLYGPLRLAHAEIDEETIRIGLSFPFHVKRINDPKNLKALQVIATEVLGYEPRVIVEHKQTVGSPKADVAKESPKSRSIPAIKDDPDAVLMTDPLSIVRNVFGNAEVL